MSGLLSVVYDLMCPVHVTDSPIPQTARFWHVFCP